MYESLLLNQLDPGIWLFWYVIEIWNYCADIFLRMFACVFMEDTKLDSYACPAFQYSKMMQWYTKSMFKSRATEL